MLNDKLYYKIENEDLKLIGDGLKSIQEGNRGNTNYIKLNFDKEKSILLLH
eukprot:gene12006-5406_t